MHLAEASNRNGKCPASQTFLDSQIHQQVETYPRSELNKFLKSEKFQMQTPGSIGTSLQTGKWVHRLQGYLLLYPNKPTVQEIHVPTFFHPRSILPNQSPTIWSAHCSNGNDNSSQGNQADGSKQGYKNTPVPRQLVGHNHQTCLQHTQTLADLCQKLG